MKFKRWLSKALVLAMVVALMIPVPVAAKGGGGKLVKSVTTYQYEQLKSGAGRWKATSQQTFKYDKKNYPVELGRISYNPSTHYLPPERSKGISCGLLFSILSERSKESK